MKVYRLMKWNNDGSSNELFKTFDKYEFREYIIDSIMSQKLSFDPGCNYPSIYKQVNMFSEYFDKGFDTSDGIDRYHWIDIHEIDPNTSREDYIWCKMYEHYKEAKELGHEIFAIILQGSQNYGLDIYTEEYKSDVDTKCIVLPNLDDIILNHQPVSTTHERENKEHIDLKDIRLMFDTFKKQNVNFVEVLFSDYYIVPDKYKDLWEELRSIAEKIVHAHPAQTLRAMSGMSMEKKKALKHPYPTIIHKIEKYGYDPKQLHHIVRINDFIVRFIDGLPFKEAMTPSKNIKEYLLKIKLGSLNLKEAEQLATEYDDDSRRLKNLYIEANGDTIVDTEVYKKLDAIKAKALKNYFIEMLSGEQNDQ